MEIRERMVCCFQSAVCLQNMELDVFKSAYEFVDQLKAAGQGCWQILPLDQPATEIHRISLFPLLQEILILSVWKT